MITYITIFIICLLLFVCLYMAKQVAIAVEFSRYAVSDFHRLLKDGDLGVSYPVAQSSDIRVIWMQNYGKCTVKHFVPTNTWTLSTIMNMTDNESRAKAIYENIIRLKMDAPVRIKGKRDQH